MEKLLDGDTPKSKVWIGPLEMPDQVQDGLKEYPPIHRQILFNRGILSGDAATGYLLEKIENHEPLMMKGLPEAVKIIRQVIKEKEFIFVYGDYDVDGVTATALMVKVIRALGGSVMPYIPNRFDEGYGLNCEAIQTLKDQGANLIVTVDCGIRSVQEAELARELGVQLVITDHHHPRDVVPLADAVICPRQIGDEYPFKDLAGVGLAYKLAQALFEAEGRDALEVDQWLDLVALGTVADIAPLVGENRVLVKKGLRNIQQGRCCEGIYSLARVANINPQRITAGDIGYVLGPRLNASGRLDSALKSLEILMQDDLLLTGKTAQELDDANRERQEITRKNQEFAETQFQDIEKLPILIALGNEEEFHQGIVGLVAARLTQTHYRPAVVGVISEDATRASCRSIDEFHITNALDECADLMVRHGGHAKAAGFTVLNKNRDALISRLNEIASRELVVEELQPSIKYDAEVSFSDLQMPLMKFLEKIEPTGNENPQPVFLARNLKVSFKKVIGKEQTHLKLKLEDATRISQEVIAFRQAQWFESMPERIDVVFTFELNEYNGQTSFQLNAKDIRPSEPYEI